LEPRETIGYWRRTRRRAGQAAWRALVRPFSAPNLEEAGLASLTSGYGKRKRATGGMRLQTCPARPGARAYSGVYARRTEARIAIEEVLDTRDDSRLEVVQH
jgi:hypothetical protein